jgi:hypothetical protein
MLWKETVRTTAKLSMERHFSAQYGMCTVTLDELKAVLKVSTLADQTKSSIATGQQTTLEDGFREVRKRQQTWTPTLPVAKSLQMRRQFLAKHLGRPQ